MARAGGGQGAKARGGASGGNGLLFNEAGTGLEDSAKIVGLPVGNPPGAPNSTRKQLQVRTINGNLVPAWDAIIERLRALFTR